jgi:hypothetical protein
MAKTNLLIAGVLLGGLSGCTTYYRITDPTTGKAYYSTELKQDGATSFKDARTGDSITLQNVEVRKISKEDFEAGKAEAPTAATSPAK